MRYEKSISPASRTRSSKTNISEPRPHFFCIGPGNSGTTWIADHLKLQRDVWLPPIQELGYLNAGFERFRGSKHLTLQWDWWSVFKRIVRNKSLSLGNDRRFLKAARELARVPDSKPDLDLYQRLFEPAGDRITGDISPSYAELEIDEIRRFSPVLTHAKIFMLARDPVERFWSAVSMYWRDRVFGDVDYRSLEFIQLVFRDRSGQNLPSQVVHRWQCAIGEDRLKIFFFDDLAAQPISTYREIAGYIGADHRKRIPVVSPAYNRKLGARKIDVPPEVREWVRIAFQPELRACADLLGAHGEKWLKRHAEPLKA